jgi:hypothetical protein
MKPNDLLRKIRMVVLLIAIVAIGVAQWARWMERGERERYIAALQLREAAQVHPAATPSPERR